ncbi:unnamed protein product [Linum trigynum]|uniref:Uncharacterized protein n=1 Tax=Linum trigynum TaxID=586398 RepID=A0AAV2DBG0_9ROSI
MLVDVEFCHVPQKCEKCGLFGHDCAYPGGEVKRVWVVKQPKVKEVISASAKGKEQMVEMVVAQAYSQETASEVAGIQAEASVQVMVVEQVSETMVVPVESVVGDNSSTPEPDDGFHVVTSRKHRVRAPDPASVAKSPWNLFSGQKKMRCNWMIKLSLH